MDDKKTWEESALKKSMVGALVLAAWGISMSLVSGSSAVMLDGMYNFLSGILSYLFIIVSRLTWSGKETRSHPLGYFAYESLLIFLKGAMIFILVVMAVYSNVRTLLAGGREPDLSLMVVYVALAVLGCLILYFVCRRAWRKAGSELLETEMKAWLINAVVSGAIGVALGIAILLEGTSLDWVRRYVDQILVILMSLAFIKEPVIFMRNGLAELLMAAPQEKIAGPIVTKIHSMKEELGARELSMDVQKTGRRIWVFVWISPKADSVAVSDWKGVVERVRGAVTELYEHSHTEVVLEPA